MLLAFTLVSFAQNERKSQNRENQFTSEQNAILKTKQMVLQLDLNKFQEDQLLPYLYCCNGDGRIAQALPRLPVI